ncbi:PAAR domain-containing protein [Amantichitinum ursilacus]|uniref:PAAR motif protein n=1 Tax=Amantichitinum ursilacus TaxID=857265 RepID=A0A0N0GMR2_9NEIS|nr:PAAR domain-containing protein [Amantichitinum ursilacus]KPC52001.1 PAAR motif protein [Amantichitinum ursilacus]
MKKVIRLGDTTDHGGTVTSASATASTMGKAIACVGDKVSCPKHNHGTTTIVEGDPTWTIDGKAVALEGHKTSCGAVLIASVENTAKG